MKYRNIRLLRSNIETLQFTKTFQHSTFIFRLYEYSLLHQRFIWWWPMKQLNSKYIKKDKFVL